jgi:hypothetical protein
MSSSRSKLGLPYPVQEFPAESDIKSSSGEKTWKEGNKNEQSGLAVLKVFNSTLALCNGTDFLSDGPLFLLGDV